MFPKRSVAGYNKNEGDHDPFAMHPRTGHVITFSSDSDEDAVTGPLGVLGPSHVFVPLASTNMISIWVSSQRRICGPFKLIRSTTMAQLAMVMYIFDANIPQR